MIHERQTQIQDTGRSAIFGSTARRDGLIRLLESVSTCRPPPSGYCPTIHRQQQRKAGRVHVSHEFEGMDQQRHLDSGTSRTGGIQLAHGDTQGHAPQSCSMVRRDLGITRLVARNGHQAGSVRARLLHQKRSTSGHRKNASLTPPDGGYWQGITPPHGARAVPPTPPNGAMRTNLAHLSTPSHGDLYRCCHLSQVFQSKEPQ